MQNACAASFISIRAPADQTGTGGITKDIVLLCHAVYLHFMKKNKTN